MVVQKSQHGRKITKKTKKRADLTWALLKIFLPTPIREVSVNRANLSLRVRATSSRASSSQSVSSSLGVNRQGQ
jgi:hypothetical protein